jgi:phage tail sheath protein FI
MPEYLAPGVYVEETSFRAKSIEGVSTTTTGFVGPTRYGPVDLDPEIVTSMVEFERLYGDRQRLGFYRASGDPPDILHNYIWHAARAFFEEGGKRLYVARIFRPIQKEEEDLQYKRPPAELKDDIATLVDSKYYTDGHARKSLPEGAITPDLQIRARFPGAVGNVRVRFELNLGPNVLSGQKQGELSVASIRNHDTVWIGDVVSPIGSPLRSGALCQALFDETKNTWVFKDKSDHELHVLNEESGSPSSPPRGLFPEIEIRKLTLTLTVLPSDPSNPSVVWNNIPPDPNHTSVSGAPDALTTWFVQNPNSMSLARSLPIVISAGVSITNGIELLDLLFPSPQLDDYVTNRDLLKPENVPSVEYFLEGGNDGMRPIAQEYEGDIDDEDNKTGLKSFEDLDDISIVAIPGCTAGYTQDTEIARQANASINAMIAHATRMRYRIAVVDSGEDMTVSEVREMKAKIDSSYAAFYYPWVTLVDPVTDKEINLPPSGFVAGIYARNDINRAVFKAPANEVVMLATGFENFLNRSQQEVLNPEGINCFRFFPGRGFRLWGARTTSSDPEFKYVNIRRYLAYLEHSIDKGTQWAVFESNGPLLWSNVKIAVEDFLYNEFVTGAFVGDKPDRCFFVKCDRSTMTQNDLDNGRLVCLIGVAIVKPAEFVIFRIGQWTADRKV